MATTDHLSTSGQTKNRPSALVVYYYQYTMGSLKSPLAISDGQKQDLELTNQRNDREEHLQLIYPLNPPVPGQNFAQKSEGYFLLGVRWNLTMPWLLMDLYTPVTSPIEDPPIIDPRTWANSSPMGCGPQNNVLCYVQVSPIQRGSSPTYSYVLVFSELAQASII